jgi:hypothetical protein
VRVKSDPEKSNESKKVDGFVNNAFDAVQDHINEKTYDTLENETDESSYELKDISDSGYSNRSTTDTIFSTQQRYSRKWKNGTKF